MPAEVNIWGMKELLKDNHQRKIFDFLFDRSTLPNGEVPGFHKIVLQAQSFRDEASKIEFPNGSAGYRMEMNDEVPVKNKQPTVVFYFLENGEVHFRLQEATIEGKVIKGKKFDHIKGIPATNIPEKDLETVTKALRLNDSVLICNQYPHSLIITPIREKGFISFQLNPGNSNRIIHGRVTTI